MTSAENKNDTVLMDKFRALSTLRSLIRLNFPETYPTGEGYL